MTGVGHHLGQAVRTDPIYAHGEFRGLDGTMKRKAARVISNMCKLFEDPVDVAPSAPLLLQKVRNLSL